MKVATDHTDCPHCGDGAVMLAVPAALPVDGMHTLRCRGCGEQFVASEAAVQAELQSRSSWNVVYQCDACGGPGFLVFPDAEYTSHVHTCCDDPVHIEDAWYSRTGPHHQC